MILGVRAVYSSPLLRRAAPLRAALRRASGSAPLSGAALMKSNASLITVLFGLYVDKKKKKGILLI